MKCFACVGDSACMCEGRDWRDFVPYIGGYQKPESGVRFWDSSQSYCKTTADAWLLRNTRQICEALSEPVNLPCPEDCGE